MKKLLLLILLWPMHLQQLAIAQTTTPFSSSLSVEQLTEAPAQLIPFPQDLHWEGTFLPLKKVQLNTEVPLSNSLSTTLQGILDYYRIPSSTKDGLPLQFIHQDTLQSEGYLLHISRQGIQISAATESGHFYALQSLRQLIQYQEGQLCLPLCRIHDAPAFPVRGYMIDVGRNFQSIATLKKQLDIMAMYKLNTFHWHLTDRPAWRIESKKYPELTAPENHRPSRSPGQFYSYAAIRDLFQYAKERHIRIIPEIDMPGHSDSFVRSMGVKMESEKGMKILENVLHEFFQEIPLEDCPIIHIGSDEVHIQQPKAFIDRMVGICEKNGRTVVIWNPGLPANKNVIRQTWQAKHLKNEGYQEIDAWNNYINNGEPLTQIQRLFFKPIGYRSPNKVIGGILCLWPDVRLEKGSDAFQQNPVYPSLLTYAWKTWTAAITEAPSRYYMTLPTTDSLALAYFAAFEQFLLHHKHRFFAEEPFPYFAQSKSKWKLIGPFQNKDGDALLKDIQATYPYQNRQLKWKKAIGSTLVIKDRFRLGGHFPEAGKGESVYALTYIHSDQNKTIDCLIGFETPMRANRTYTGIPEQGNWDVSGGNIWVNDVALPPPIWKDAGWRPSKSEGWSIEHREKSWAKEELYWTRAPSRVVLKKGWNKILVSIPCSSNYQNWMFSFIPLEMEGLSFSYEPIND